MSNPFETHGIAHLSPSSCNKFAAAPALFVMEKVLHNDNLVGPGAHRGSAAEAGINAGLMDPTLPLHACVAEAHKVFREKQGLALSEKAQDEFDALAGYVATGLAELRPYGVPTATQGYVSVDVPGLAVPLVGYFDWEWAQHGILTDLKTTKQCPSKISVPHARQVSVYKRARNTSDPRVSYVTPKKSATYRLESPDEHFKALVKIALTIQRFLALSADGAELAALVCPDVDTFYYNDPLTRAKAFEIWGV